MLKFKCMPLVPPNVEAQLYPLLPTRLGAPVSRWR